MAQEAKKVVPKPGKDHPKKRKAASDGQKDQVKKPRYNNQKQKA